MRYLYLSLALSVSPFVYGEETSKDDKGVYHSSTNDIQVVFDSAYDVLEKDLKSNQLIGLTIQQEQFLKSITYDELNDLGNHDFVPLSNIIQSYINHQEMLTAFQSVYQGNNFTKIEGCELKLSSLPLGQTSLDIAGISDSSLNVDIPKCFDSLSSNASNNEITYMVTYELESLSGENHIRLFNDSPINGFDRQISLRERDTGKGFSYDTNIISLANYCIDNGSCNSPLINIENSSIDTSLTLKLEGFFSKDALSPSGINRALSISIGGGKIEGGVQSNFVNGDFNNGVNGWSGDIEFDSSTNCFSIVDPGVTIFESPSLFFGPSIGNPAPSGQLLGDITGPAGDRFADFSELSQTINVPNNVGQLQFYLNYTGGSGFPLNLFIAGTSVFSVRAQDLTTGASTPLVSFRNSLPNQNSLVANISTPVTDLAGHTVRFVFSMCDVQDTVVGIFSYDEGVSFIDNVTLSTQAIPTPDTFEQDDVPVDFTPLFLNQAQTHNFADDTIDWAGAVFPTGSFKLFATSVGSDASICLSVFRPNANATNTSGSPIVTDCSGAGQSSSVTFNTISGDGFFFRVTNSNGQMGFDTEYTLLLEDVSVTPDLFEQDDVPADFSPLFLNQGQTHNFADDTIDWAGAVFPTGSFRLFATSVGSNASICLSVFRPNENATNTSGPPIATDCSGAGQSSSVTFNTVHGDGFFFRVTNSNGQVGFDTDYILNLTAN